MSLQDFLQNIDNKSNSLTPPMPEIPPEPLEQAKDRANDIKRIADALERIATALENTNT